MPTPDRQASHFEGVAGRYFSARRSPNHLLYKELLWSAALKAVRPPAGTGTLDVLEPMCGYAEGKTIVERHYHGLIRYEGFDTSPTLLEQVAKTKPDAVVFKGDVRDFAPKKKYDVVIISGGLHHVYRDAAAVLSMVVRALKDDGVFVNLEPTQNVFATRVARRLIYKSNPFFDPQTERAFDLPELNRLYKNAGLAVVRQVYPGLLAHVLYYNPDAFPILNIGGPLLVRSLFFLDRLFMASIIGKLLSFATLTVLTTVKKVPA
jgi:SAM-dependent methyltransferase